MANDTEKKVLTDFVYITDIPTYTQALAEFDTTQPIALDTETMVRPEYEGKGGTALSPHTGRVSLVICCQPESKIYVFDLLHLEAAGYDPELLVKTLDAAPYLLCAQAKFDAQQLRGTLGYEPLKLRDVILIARLLTNATGSKAGKAVGHSYKDLCREWLDVHIGGKGTLQKSSWGVGLEARTLENEWWLEKVTYAAHDVKYLFPLQDKMLPILLDPLPDSPLTKTGNKSHKWGFGMKRVFEREMRFIPVVASMEYEGLPIDKELMGAFQQAVKEELLELAVYLSKELKLDTPQRDWRGKETPSPKALKVLRSSTGLLQLVQQALNFKKIDNVQAAMLKRLLQIIENFGSREAADSDEEAFEDSEQANFFVNEDEQQFYQELVDRTAEDLATSAPLVKAILDFKRLVKQDGMDLRKYINPATGRVHPSYNQLGTATSRLSSSNFNAQQISNKTKVVIGGVPLST